MRSSDAGLALIRRFEGFSATPYRCPAGYMTIGYGHMLAPGEHYDRIDEEKAQLLLRQDVRVAEYEVMRLVTRVVHQGAFDALASFTFNLGGAALQRSALRRAINRGDDEETARQWMRWVYAGGRIMQGLVTRRKAELALYFPT